MSNALQATPQVTAVQTHSHRVIAKSSIWSSLRSSRVPHEHRLNQDRPRQAVPGVVGAPVDGGTAPAETTWIVLVPGE